MKTFQLSAVCACLALGALLPRAARSGEPGQPAGLQQVEQERTWVYQRPDQESPLLRRLYLGELVQPLSIVEAEDGVRWVEISLGENERGFVLEHKLVPAGKLPESHYRRERVARDERPFAFAARGLGETYGVALDFRYLPLARLGITGGVGMLLDKEDVRGRSLRIGLVSHIALYALSPYIEAGIVDLAYYQGRNTLRLTAFYMTAGVEYMFDFGGFAALGMTYMRSVDIEVAYAWANRDEDLSLKEDPFGILGKRMDGDVFQDLAPTLSIGYAF